MQGAVNHNSVTRWFNIFCSLCKNLNVQVKLKTVDSEAVLQTIKLYPKSGTRSISGLLGISLSNVVLHLHVHAKSGEWHSESIRLARHLTVQCGSSPSRPRQIWRVALGEYQASSASHCPMWFFTFTSTPNLASGTRRVSG